MPRNKKDPNETREQTFVRLATLRIGRALNFIRLIGNLSAYQSTAEQRAKILRVLRESIDDLEYKLGGEKQAKKEAFTFGEGTDDF